MLDCDSLSLGPFTVILFDAIDVDRESAAKRRAVDENRHAIFAVIDFLRLEMLESRCGSCSAQSSQCISSDEECKRM